MSQRSKHARAFSLVEVLIVVAVIAVIMSLLIPALVQAREAAYIATCGGNMRQAGIVIANYAASWKENVPPACSRTDTTVISSGSFAGKVMGPMTNLSTGLQIVGSSSGRGNFARIDTDVDYSWTNGIALAWAQGFAPYDLGGGRILWCPGERNGNYSKSTGYPLFGPGRYWNASGTWKGLQDNPNSVGKSVATGTWTVMSSYAYRALGTNITYGGFDLANGISKGSWRLSSLAPYVASVDYVGNVYGADYWGDPITAVYSHGASQGRYTGINRLWYDGHVKWLSDPTAQFMTYKVPGLGNTLNENQWRKYYDPQ